MTQLLLSQRRRRTGNIHIQLCMHKTGGPAEAWLGSSSTFSSPPPLVCGERLWSLGGRGNLINCAQTLPDRLQHPPGTGPDKQPHLYVHQNLAPDQAHVQYVANKPCTLIYTPNLANVQQTRLIWIQARCIDIYCTYHCTSNIDQNQGLLSTPRNLIYLYTHTHNYIYTTTVINYPYQTTDW